jgi:DNA-binding NarL/FixJ family response regulator
MWEEIMPDPDLIKVMCVDDHPLVRDGVRLVLHQQNDMQLVAEASNGLEALVAFRKSRPDVTLMDLKMPLMDGMEATSAIRQEFLKAKIVILTTYSGDVKASRAFRLGVSGYLLKGFPRRELIDTIRGVHTGQRRIPSDIAADMFEHYNADELSAREIQVLRQVAGGHANKIVANNLYISEDTVKGHMKKVLAKLQASDRTHAVMIALKRGFLDAETNGAPGEYVRRLKPGRKSASPLQELTAQGHDRSLASEQVLQECGLNLQPATCNPRPGGSRQVYCRQDEL